MTERNRTGHTRASAAHPDDAATVALSPTAGGVCVLAEFTNVLLGRTERA